MISYCGSTIFVGLFFYVSTLGSLVGDIIVVAVVGLLMQGSETAQSHTTKVNSYSFILHPIADMGIPL